MRYHNITKNDMLNGDGLRVVLWVAGCPHKCQGCHNPITWDICGGIEFDKLAEKEIFDELELEYISGITFSGGDPLHIDNRDGVSELIKKIHEKYPNKTMWLYTGFEWEQIKHLDFLKHIDVLIDGKFVEELKDAKLHWKGSSNQRVIDVKQTISNNRIILYA